MPKVFVEIAVETAEQARVAIAAGADRLEVSRDLQVDGLTASARVIREVVAVAAGRPVLALVRCRGGGFVYSEPEVAEMERSAAEVVEAGATGVVFGALDESVCVDERACARIVAACSGREAVFHRAIDEADDPLQAVITVAGLGFSRVLMGGVPLGEAGGWDDGARAARIGAVVGMAKIDVCVCGGVRSGNVARVVELTGAREVHSSCRVGGRVSGQEAAALCAAARGLRG